jgi:hypothetical protein
MITETVSPEWQFLGRGRIDVARSQTTETAVAETGIAFVLKQVFEVLWMD